MIRVSPNCRLDNLTPLHANLAFLTISSCRADTIAYDSMTRQDLWTDSNGTINEGEVYLVVAGKDVI